MPYTTCDVTANRIRRMEDPARAAGVTLRRRSAYIVGNGQAGSA